MLCQIYLSFISAICFGKILHISWYTLYSKFYSPSPTLSLSHHARSELTTMSLLSMLFFFSFSFEANLQRKVGGRGSIIYFLFLANCRVVCREPSQEGLTQEEEEAFGGLWFQVIDTRQHTHTHHSEVLGLMQYNVHTYMQQSVECLFTVIEVRILFCFRSTFVSNWF